MPRFACFAFLAAFGLLSGCEQPVRTSGEVAADGLGSAIDRLPDAEGTMTNSAPSSPLPGGV